jgi:hypothetical protein
MLPVQHKNAARQQNPKGAIMKFICAFTILGMFLSLATAENADIDGNAGRYAIAALAQG